MAHMGLGWFGFGPRPWRQRVKGLRVSGLGVKGFRVWGSGGVCSEC